jgi:uncharacterized membrane protein YdjX (TVP38/TMEM64 family)
MGESQGHRGADAGPASPGLMPRSIWPLLVLAVAAAAALYSGLSRYGSFEMLVDSRDMLMAYVQRHYALALATYMAAWGLLALLAMPGGLLLTMAGGFLFGAGTATAATVLSATLGGCVLFLGVRTSLGQALRSGAGPWLARFSRGFNGNAASYLLFLRFVPLFPFWLVNLAPAILGARFVPFAWTTLVGIVPGTFAHALAGSGLEGVIADRKQAYADCIAAGLADCRLDIRATQLITPEILVAFGLLGLLALLPVAWKVWRRTARRPVAVGASGA